ncbi:hypothetical protein ACFVR1_01820 [Psychrobacillus sp. NPDC058041]|uniref:hypothetical protein n=1 Tax=Psychrobacillus sp. NPDC058041 TaxID=3346310 RepID=UPI0036D7D58E
MDARCFLFNRTIGFRTISKISGDSGKLEKVFPYYERWAANEKGISKKITTITNNSVYIMAAIRYKTAIVSITP